MTHKSRKTTHTAPDRPVGMVAAAGSLFAPQLVIDPEFAAICPPLSAEEDALLGESLSAHGCRDPLVGWKSDGGCILVDGHNRYRKCRELRIPYRVVFVDFKDRADVVEYIVRNQLARRNLTDAQKKALRGKRYSAEKRRHGGNQKSTCQSDKSVQTHVKLAGEFGVSPASIIRDEKFAKAVDAIADAGGNDAEANLLSGKVKLTDKEVAAVLDLPKADLRMVAAAVAEGDGQSVGRLIGVKAKRAAKPDTAGQGPLGRGNELATSFTAAIKAIESLFRLLKDHDQPLFTQQSRAVSEAKGLIRRARKEVGEIKG